MGVASPAGASFEPGGDERFSGDVWLRGTQPAPDGSNVVVVHFTAASRTHWHRHPGGQFLFGLSGRGRVRTRGQPGLELLPGDIAYTGPQEWHFHGAGTDAPMVHVSVNLGGQPEWGEPVADEEYGDGF